VLLSDVEKPHDLEHSRAKEYNLLEDLANLLSPSHLKTTHLSSMEERKVTQSSTLIPHPQHSIADTLSLSATKTSQILSDSPNNVF
jgi:hypothetical protein